MIEVTQIENLNLTTKPFQNRIKKMNTTCTAMFGHLATQECAQHNLTMHGIQKVKQGRQFYSFFTSKTSHKDTNNVALKLINWFSRVIVDQASATGRSPWVPHKSLGSRHNIMSYLWVYVYMPRPHSDLSAPMGKLITGVRQKLGGGGHFDQSRSRIECRVT